MKGYILMSKTLLDSSIWNKPSLYIKVWMYLLMNACYSDVGNLKRGQVLTSIPDIQEACTYYVGYRKVTPTYKEVRSVIDFLRNPDEGRAKGSMIVTTKVTHGFIATICNYDLYQDFATYEGQDEGRTKDERRARQGQNKKNKDITNKTNKNNLHTNKDARPTLEEVKDYVLEKEINVDAKRFYDYFEAGEWVDSKGNPVRNWKQKLISWGNSNGNTIQSANNGAVNSNSGRMAGTTSRGKGNSKNGITKIPRVAFGFEEED